jgi:hypothetical protein
LQLAVAIRPLDMIVTLRKSLNSNEKHEEV